MDRVRARLLSCAGTVALVLMAAAGSTGGQATSEIRISAISNRGSGVVTSSPAGINCTLVGRGGSGTCSAQFATGTPVTLTATPAAHNTFGTWGNLSLSGQCPSTSLTCQITAGQPGLTGIDLSFTAELYTLTIAAAGNGTGIVYGNVAELAEWYGAGVINCNIVGGVIVSGPCTTQYPAGLPIRLGFTNSHTSTGSIVIYDPPLGLMPAAPLTIVATVKGPGFRIVSAGGPGTGRVVSTTGDAGIDCTVSPTGVTGSCHKDYGLTPLRAPVTLQATPSPGSTFLGWSGACSGTGTCQYDDPVIAIKDYVANFGLATTALTVSGSGTGSGTVTSTPTGVSCSVAAGATTGTCAGTFATGTAVALQATPSAGSTFGGWTGGGCSGTGGCSLTMNTAQSVTAQFTALTPTIAVTGAGSGSVSSAPAGIACTITNGTASGTCASPFAYGADLTLTATPASGWTFAGWGGACTGTGTCKPDVTADRAVTATFVPVPVATVALKVTGAGSGDGIVTSSPGALHCVVTKGAGNDAGCTALLPQNAAVTLTADPQSASIFAGWAGNGCSGAALTCTLTLSEARNVVARFMAPRPGREIAGMMLSGAALPADERAQLDRFGNKDGVLNLGDLLALLDRTGEHLTASVTAALVAAERRGTGTPTTPTTSPRRTP